MNKIFYFHIPKTGGQTLATRIASAFPVGKSCIIGEELTFPNGFKVLTELFKKYDFVEKHVIGPIFLNYDKSKYHIDFLLTIRSPLEAIVSSYLHAKRDPINRLYNLINNISFEQFFRHFGDLIGNFQTKYLISAFHKNKYIVDGELRTAEKINETLDNFRWIIPTEFIDEFCLLWQIETEKLMLSSDIVLNKSPYDNNVKEELKNILSRFPQLYSLDTILYQEAKKRYMDYKNKIICKFANKKYFNNQGLVWQKEECVIWLKTGWHLPELINSTEHVWWNKDQSSFVYVKRNNFYKFLSFTVKVFLDVFPEQIIITSENDARIDYDIKKTKSGEFEYICNIENMPEEFTIKITVPIISSMALYMEQVNDFTRKSIATYKWELREQPYSLVHKTTSKETL